MRLKSARPIGFHLFRQRAAFLHAEDVRPGLAQPIAKAFLLNRPQAVHVPRKNLHTCFTTPQCTSSRLVRYSRTAFTNVLASRFWPSATICLSDQPG